MGGKPNHYLLAVGREIQLWEWDGVSDKSSSTNKKTLFTVDDHFPTNRLNDGKCDANGRLWAGTSSIYYLDVLMSILNK